MASEMLAQTVNPEVVPAHPLVPGIKYSLPARTGIAIPLRENETIKIINTYGQQVVDFWALGLDSRHELSCPPLELEYMSMSHTRASTNLLSPRVNTTLLTNLRAPILQLIEDTTPGIHDTLIPACDPIRYRLLGVEEWHASCAENFHLALQKLSVEVPEITLPSWLLSRRVDNSVSSRTTELSRPGVGQSQQSTATTTISSSSSSTSPPPSTYWCPDPLNLFMNIPFSPTSTSHHPATATVDVSRDNPINLSQGLLQWSPPTSSPSQHVIFRSLRGNPVVVIMSACPQDLIAINDPERGPTGVDFVLG